MKSLKQHPFVILGVIIFFAVTALVVFRLSSGAKTDNKKTRVITVGTTTPLKQDLPIRLAYTADIIPNQVVRSSSYPGGTWREPAPFRLFFGQPDPQNDARWTLRYTAGDQEGFISGLLQPDGSVRWAIESGPARPAPAAAR